MQSRRTSSLLPSPIEQALVCLDRDGTLIEDVGYPRRPEDVRLLPGTVPALQRLAHARIPVVVVSNQSGVARGLLTLEAVWAVQARFEFLLAEEGVQIDGFFFCPHHPQGAVSPFNLECRCRKPRPGLVEQARSRLGLNAGPLAVVGDKASDVALAKDLGGVGIRVGTGGEPADGEAYATVNPDFVARDVLEAVLWLLNEVPGFSPRR